jgi:hypothetical protein
MYQAQWYVEPFTCRGPEEQRFDDNVQNVSRQVYHEKKNPPERNDLQARKNNTNQNQRVGPREKKLFRRSNATVVLKSGNSTGRHQGYTEVA